MKKREMEERREGEMERVEEEEEQGVFKCEPVLMSLVRVWNSLFKAAIILINVVNEPLIAVMDLTLQLTTTHTHTQGRCKVCVCVYVCVGGWV